MQNNVSSPLSFQSVHKSYPVGLLPPDIESSDSLNLFWHSNCRTFTFKRLDNSGTKFELDSETFSCKDGLSGLQDVSRCKGAGVPAFLSAPR